MDCWAENNLVRLHYLDNGGDHPGLPVLFVPGLQSSAANFRPILEALLPRRAVAVDLRGRGQSDAPDIGYRFEDHVSDVAAVVKRLSVSRLCLFGHSIGVTYAIGYAAQQPKRVSALMLSNYVPEYPLIPADWVMHVMTRFPREMPMQAVLGLQQESEAISLWDSLATLTCPVLVMRGGRSTARLKAEGVERYLQHVPRAKIAVFEESGSRLWRPDQERFIRTVTTFLDEIEPAS